MMLLLLRRPPACAALPDQRDRTAVVIGYQPGLWAMSPGIRELEEILRLA
jgi:hypothetical protein